MSVYLFFQSKRKEKQLMVTGSTKKERKQAVWSESFLLFLLFEKDLKSS